MVIPEFTREEYERFASEAPKRYRNSIDGGKVGLGDPDYKKITFLESKYGVPAKKREIIFQDYCPEVNAGYEFCKKNYKFLRWKYCYNFWDDRRICLDRYWNNPELQKRAEREYLEDRAYIQKYGLLKKPRKSMEQWESYDQYVKNCERGYFATVKAKIFGE